MCFVSSQAMNPPKVSTPRFRFNLKLVGSFHQTAMFFNAVADLSRIVNINNLTLGSPRTNGGVTTLSVDCLATTFRFLEEKGK